MDRKITIRIAEREYIMNAPTPESEELIRLAASSINSKLSGFQAKYPGKNMADLLAFVALNESIGSTTLQRKLDSLKKEIDSLNRATDSYLDSIEENGRQ